MNPDSGKSYQHIIICLIARTVASCCVSAWLFFGVKSRFRLFYSLEHVAFAECAGQS